MQSRFVTPTEPIAIERLHTVRLALSQQTLTLLWQRHGEQIDTFWRGQFGYGIDCLPEVEAQNLCRQPSVAAIEDFLAQAAIEARGRGFEPIL
jgi:hypothetical protein